MVVSVKLAVVNFPREPLAVAVDAWLLLPAVLAAAGEVTDEVEEVVEVAELCAFDDGWDEAMEFAGVKVTPDAVVLNAVIVSKETVGFFIFPSLTCKGKYEENAIHIYTFTYM